ncbi:sodium-independent sulfate anion transporter isoform X2 [Agrilus planipennis]|uniref:Sodium-independent sulfate anion transporter isoform X2 n=1 Tax=Agrilus planipennis TaxID=224129 RepID=A0A1W4XEN4_AGRPL|nr:sodium-independent sulfate anion transporter isoform X2 [Agrilus planipennis]
MSVLDKSKMASFKQKMRSLMYNRLPILKWAPNYGTNKLVSDAVAGITVGLTAMPQALAYATLAGLEPQYGLYSAFVGCFVYIIFGSVKEITIGPTALMALMTYQQIEGRNVDYAILLCFLSGVVQLLMAFLNLGVLVDFISIPVTVGFTSATSVIIATTQLKGLLGLKISSSGFTDTIRKVVRHLDETRWHDLSLGLTCIIVLLLFRKIKDIKLTPSDKKPTKNQKILSRVLWLTSISRNAIVVIACSILAYNLKNSSNGCPFVLTGTVRGGFPSVAPPPFSTELNNKTIPFTEMVTDLGTSIVLVPIIAVLGNVAIAKAFATGKTVDATQELFTLSLCNIIGSFVSSMPITGSFSRSAVNHASGVQTPMGGLFTGIMVILALSFLTPYFSYIPKASLSAVIICAVIFMIEYEVVKPMWRSSRKDLVPTFATFVLCLAIGVEIGILIGVGINIIFLLYPSARPTIHVEKKTIVDSGIEYILVTPGNSLYFPAIEFIKSSVVKAGLSSSHLPVVVDCRFILGVDFTAAKGISSMITEFMLRNQPLYFINPKEEVIAVFKGAVMEDFQYFKSVDDLQQHLSDQKEKAKTIFSEETKLLPTGQSEEPASVTTTDLREIKCVNGCGNFVQHSSSSC